MYTEKWYAPYSLEVTSVSFKGRVVIKPVPFIVCHGRGVTNAIRSLIRIRRSPLHLSDTLKTIENWFEN